MREADVIFAAEKLKQLVGSKIVDTAITEQKDSYGFVVEKNGVKKICWVDCDPEGNGPGFVSVHDMGQTHAKNEYDD